MRPDLLQELKRRLLLADGAMGTQLMAAGLPAGHCGMLWNVERPDVVQEIHRRYRRAGCQLITTNSFQGSRTALSMHGLAERTAELNRAAAANARTAAGDDAWVLADLGPFGGFLEPLGETTPAQLQAIFVEQLQALRQGGADAVIIETMSDPAELAVAVTAAKKVAGWPVLATYAFEVSAKTCARPGERIYRTMMGATVAEALSAAQAAGADAVGANCGTALDLDDYQLLADRMLAAVSGKVPVILQPNAGAPRVVDGRTVHPATPAQMGKLAKNLRAAGVKIIGGCCGTTPDHLAAMAEALAEKGD